MARADPGKHGATRGDHDVIIAGGGFVGRTLAVALRKSAPDLKVALLAGGPAARAGEDDRASAIAAAARRMFVRLEIWPDIAAGAFPIEAMTITDSRLADTVRPELLSFRGEVGLREPFAFMVENRALAAALETATRAAEVEEASESVRDFVAGPEGIAVRLASGREIGGRLLVAADGAASRLRALAGIGTIGRSYRQKGIVTTVTHQRPNGGRAIQHFLPAGPLAILPLGERRASIVWTEAAAQADRLIALDDFTFALELERRFGPELGALELAGSRQAFPLGVLLARRYAADRFALAGDAAHVIHPLAGQGLNLGLRDAATLAEAVVEAHRLGLDPGVCGALDSYDRLRRLDVIALALVTDGLNALFSNDLDPLRLVRDTGLALVDRAAGLKAIFMRQAAGVDGDVPRLMRGEAI